ncbi:carbamoylphosphate synthase large subunit [Xylariaceae sp. FL0804]|nr:carbamoylphosphate synthase large subunit [Xylariaceae sp. FL0804]
MARGQLRETARCFCLVLFSLYLLPASLAAVILLHLVQKVSTSIRLEPQVQNARQNGHSRKTILVTGVGMAKGLTLARSFYLAGHRVIGADFEDAPIPCSGRFSKALSRFYRLPRPHQDAKSGGQVYIAQLIKIIQVEKVDLWVSCSGVASAVEDAEAKEAIEQNTHCKCIQFDVPTTSALHEKDTFTRECQNRSLPVPETHNVTSGGDVLRILSAAAVSHPDRRFIMKPVGMDDAHRGDMTLLPLASGDAATRAHVARLPVSAARPWILQQFVGPGGAEYCTHALVVRGEVRCFAACPSAELLMHYSALPQHSALWQAMLDFTRRFVERSPEGGAASMTGHLSFDFMVDGGVAAAARLAGASGGGLDDVRRNMYAIECNPRAHTAVVLFAARRGDGREVRDMVQAYLSAVDDHRDAGMEKSGSEAVAGALVTPPPGSQPRYWLGHDFIALFVQPLRRLVTGADDFPVCMKEISDFLLHLLTWKEGTFELWDPLPALVLYHVYWPLTILSAWWHNRPWSRVNVSTTKMFMC